MRLRAETVFRVSALIGCAIIALPVLAQAIAGHVILGIDLAEMPPRHALATRFAFGAASVTMAMLFGAAFWRQTDTQAASASRPQKVGLLGMQCAIATLGATDYAYLLAAQAPFVFSDRGAFLWLGGQLLAFAAVVLANAGLGASVAVPEVAAGPAAIPVTIAYLGGWQVFAFSVGYLAAEERRLRREHEQRAQELLATQHLLAENARLVERTRIARDLHDTLGHSLTVLAVNLERARHLADGAAAEAVETAQTIARSLLGDVREVVHAVDDRQGVDVRHALITLCAGTPPPVIELSVPDTLRVEEPAVAQAVFRCVQEAMTNALRHAHARRLWIDARQTETELVVHIRDDGRGASVVTFGHGLEGLRERVAAVQGRLKVEAHEGRGFQVWAWIPCAPVQP